MSNDPQQPWAAPTAPPQGRKAGPGLAVVALCLGVLALVAPFLPIDETGVRHYLGFPFAIGGLVLGIVGLIGHRAGKPMAGIAVALSTIALALGVIMVGLDFLHHVGLLAG